MGDISSALFLLQNKSYTRGEKKNMEALLNLVKDANSWLWNVLLIVILHGWKNNTLLSIVGGSFCYVFLIQTVFR